MTPATLWQQQQLLPPNAGFVALEAFVDGLTHTISWSVVRQDGMERRDTSIWCASLRPIPSEPDEAISEWMQALNQLCGEISPF